MKCTCDDENSPENAYTLSIRSSIVGIVIRQEADFAGSVIPIFFFELRLPSVSV